MSFEKFLNDVADNIALIIEEASFATTESSSVKLVNRIFEESMATDEAIKKGKPYSESYKMFRNEKGLQTNRIDLQVTGAMMRSIKAYRSTLGAKIMFNNSGESKKMKEVEKMYKQKISTLNADEKQDLKDTFVYLFNERIDEIKARNNVKP